MREGLERGRSEPVKSDCHPMESGCAPEPSNGLPCTTVLRRCLSHNSDRVKARTVLRDLPGSDGPRPEVGRPGQGCVLWFRARAPPRGELSGVCTLSVSH